MSSILILLTLLSLATLASRRGGFAALLASSVPAFAAGLIAGPHALHYISIAAARTLSPATAVGVCWLGVLLGWKLTNARLRLPSLGRNVLVLGLGAVVAGLLFLAAALLTTSLSTEVIIAAGLVTAAIILPFSVAGEDPEDRTGRNGRALDLVAVVAIACAIGVVLGLKILAMLIVAVLVAMLTGAAALLVGGTDTQRRFPAVLSATTMITALAVSLDVPIGIVGVGLGVGLAVIDRERNFDGFLQSTRAPLRLVVAFLVGLEVPVTVVTSVLALTLGLSQLLVVYLVSFDKDPGTSRFDTAVLRAASSSTGLLALGSLLMMDRLPDLLGPLVVGALGLCAIIVDILAVAVLLAKKGRRAPASSGKTP